MIGLPNPTGNCLKERTDSVQGITWHWTGEGGTLFHPDPLIRLRGIWNYHVHTLGYCDIAYNGAFDADGNLFALRDNQWVGAHAASPNNLANRTTLGIVFLEDKRGMTPAGIHAQTACDLLFEASYHRHPEWYAHEFWGKQGPPAKPTYCPGPQETAYIKWLGGHV